MPNLTKLFQSILKSDAESSKYDFFLQNIPIHFPRAQIGGLVTSIIDSTPIDSITFEIGVLFRLPNSLSLTGTRI